MSQGADRCGFCSQAVGSTCRMSATVRVLPLGAVGAAAAMGRQWSPTGAQYSRRFKMPCLHAYPVPATWYDDRRKSAISSQSRPSASGAHASTAPP